MFLIAKLAYCTLSTLIVLNFSQYVEKVENMKQIEVKPNGKAEFELDMKLKNPKSKIYLYKVSHKFLNCSDVFCRCLCRSHMKLLCLGVQYLIQLIYSLQNGETLDYGDGTDDSFKHNLKKVGDKYTFTINNVGPEDSGLYQVNVEEANMFSTELDSKIKMYICVKDVKASIFNLLILEICGV